MALRRPYPGLENLEVRYTSEIQVFPTSVIPHLLEVTDESSAAQRRLQERTLLYHAADMPSQDFMPREGPTDLPGVWVSLAAGESDRRHWREQCITGLEQLCRSPLSAVEARDAGCVHCNRRYEEVDLYRCVMCRTNYVCWDHAILPACLEGLEILICAMHGRITPGPGSWNPPGGWNHPGALRSFSGRGVAQGFEHTALAEISLRPDLEARRSMSPRTRLHLQRLEAEAGVSGFNRLWRTFHRTTAGPDRSGCRRFRSGRTCFANGPESPRSRLPRQGRCKDVTGFSSSMAPKRQEWRLYRPETVKLPRGCSQKSGSVLWPPTTKSKLSHS
eukprot:271948-Amphidinium_carterae.1